MGIANPGIPSEIWGQLRPWLARFGKNTVGRSKVGAQAHCDHITRGGGECEHLALLECRICGDGVCLRHAYVGADARCICVACAADFASAAREEDRPSEPKAKSKKKKKKKRKGKKRGWNGPREAAPPPADDDEIDQAYRTFGLPIGAPIEHVKSRFRELSLLNHPDRFPDPVEKAQQERVFKKLSSAYAVLERLHRSSAA